MSCCAHQRLDERLVSGDFMNPAVAETTLCLCSPKKDRKDCHGVIDTASAHVEVYGRTTEKCCD